MKECAERREEGKRKKQEGRGESHICAKPSSELFPAASVLISRWNTSKTPFHR